MANDQGRARPDGASTAERDEPLARHIFDRYIYGDDALINIGNDLSAFFSKVGSFSWLSGADATSSSSGPGLLPLFIIVAAIVLATPRMLSWLWFMARIKFINRPGTVFAGHASRDKAGFLKRLWLPAKPIFQNVSDRIRVTKVIGTIGVGKTTFFLHFIKQDLKAGLPVVIIEMSGNAGARAIEYARRYGRPCRIFDPENEKAYKLNPIAGSDKEGIAQRFVDVVCGDYATKEEYFKKLAQVVAYYTVIAVKAWEEDYLGGEANITHILKFVSEEEYRQQVLLLGKDENTGRVVVNGHWIPEHVREYFEQAFYNYYTSDQRRSHSINLYNIMKIVIATPKIREALCPEPDEDKITLAEAVEEGALIVLRSPIETAGAGPAATLAGWLLGSLEHLTEARESKRYISLYLDEAHLILGQSNFFVADRFKNWIPMVRHRRVIIHFAYQSFFMLEYGLQKMLSSIARTTYTFGAGLGPEDGEHAAEIAGSEEQQVEDRRTIRKKFIPLRIISSLDESEMRGSRTEVRYRYQPQTIREMKAAEILATITINNETEKPLRMSFPREGFIEQKAEETAARARRRKEDLARDGRAATVGAIEGIRSERALRKAASEQEDEGQEEQEQQQPQEASSS